MGTPISWGRRFPHMPKGSGPQRRVLVELNFIEQGSITYLFGGTRTSVQAGQMALFWATVPHQIMLAEETTILHWVTIPLSSFCDGNCLLC